MLFFKVGFTAFGPSMVIETKKYIVEKLKLINEKELLEGLALAQLIPGATYVSFSIYIGYKLKGLLGAVASFIGFIFGPFSIMLVLSLLYFKYENIVFVNILFRGLGAAVVALMLNVVWNLAKTTTNNIPTIIISVTAFIISILYNNIFLILFISALMGIIFIPKNTENMKNTKIIEKTEIQRHALVDVYTLILFVLSFIMLKFVKLDSKLVILGGTILYLLMYYFK